MSGCARRGTKRNRCSDRCPMIGSRLSLAVPTRKIRRRRDQNGLSRSALLRITDSTRTSSYVRKVPRTGVLDSEQERDHRQGSVFTGAGRGDGAAAAAAVTDTKILIY